MKRSLLIDRLQADYAGGTKPETVVDEVLEAIAAAGDPGIFISLVKPEELHRRARELGMLDTAARPLWGIPFAVKDNIDVAGLPTTAACPGFSYVAKETAPSVQRLLDAGAILVGKTNLDQFATGLVGVRTPYPVPRNAIDPDLVPGGSSSGSAVAVARGLVSFALGTDTAGSGRVPAALNNIVGLKPSLGAISTRGVVPACRTLDCISVFALTTEDAWRAFETMAACDALDPFARELPLGVSGLPPTVRVGVPDASSLEFFGDAAAAHAWTTSVEDLERQGLAVREVDLSAFRATAELLYAGPWVAERYQAVREFIERQPDAMHPVTRGIIAGARNHSAADAFAGQYRLAELRRASATVWRDIDVLSVPSIPTVYTCADLAADPLTPNSRLGTYTNFVNLLDLCALAIPGKFRADGRPAGATLIAPRGRDGFLAALGARMHAQAAVALGATGQEHPHRTGSEIVAAPAGWVEVVLVGAHMSGLPLNHEVTGSGGVFLRVARTGPHYRLFALPGGPPPRPGLLRIDEAKGQRIEVEVWAMPPDRFGRFVAAIPAPLGIGTVLLDDGTRPKGFLVEAQATQAARDISEFGGWRHYLASGAK